MSSSATVFAGNMIMIIPKGTKEQGESLIDSMLKVEEYKYTNEELDFIEKVHDAESIRGAKIRWWKT